MILKTTKGTNGVVFLCLAFVSNTRMLNIQSHDQVQGFEKVVSSSQMLLLRYLTI